MKTNHISCGPFVNGSERDALNYLEGRLKNSPGEDEWFLLTNLLFSVNNTLQSDEIDIVAVGPPGVSVIEVKHWTSDWVGAYPDVVEHEAERVNTKAKKIGTTLRNINYRLPRVDGVILLTQRRIRMDGLAGKKVRGVRFYALSDWHDVIRFYSESVLDRQDVQELARALNPNAQIAIDGSLRCLAGYINLELQTAKNVRLHRVYKGIHPTRRTPVILHLYDHSATNDPNAETKARREFDSLQALQLYNWAPRILDSFQETPGYPGEMHFFTTSDPAAPTIRERTVDASWDTISRLTFARSAIQALAKLHQTEVHRQFLLHRNLSPDTVLVKHDNSPTFTGFEWTKIPAEASVSPGTMGLSVFQRPSVAPEVRAQGLGVADARSDVYSLCFCLTLLFQGRDNAINSQAVRALGEGMLESPERRTSLQDLERSVSRLLGESIAPVPAPPANYWTEDQVIRFRDRDYRILGELGSGGIGTAFKVVEVDRLTKEDLGIYVAKTAHDPEAAEMVLQSYQLVRPHLGRHPALSAIYEVTREWRENNFIVLLTWIEGAPLRDFIGLFPLLFEEYPETTCEALAVRWLRRICQGLEVLHRQGLTHGDVSPSNIILSGDDVVLTDFDFVARIGEPPAFPGTILYSPPHHENLKATPSDDIYALAASFFHVVFEKEPFQYGAALAKENGLNWQDVDRRPYPTLSAFLDKATHRDSPERFVSTLDALAALGDDSPFVIVDGDRLKRLRQDAGWTQEDLAVRLAMAKRRGIVRTELSPEIISAAEGSGSIPLALIDALAQVLGVRAAELILRPEMTAVRGDIPLLDESFVVYENLFPEEAQQDKREDIKEWIEASWHRDNSGYPFREIYAVWHLGGEALGMAFITGRIDRQWCFGNYFGLYPKARKGASSYYFADGGTSLAERFASQVIDEIREALPNVQGIVFEVDRVNCDLLEPAVDQPSLRPFFRDDKFKDQIHNLRRLQLYESWGARTLLKADGKPVSYYQPAMRKPVGPNFEVPLTLMVKLLDGLVPENMPFNDVLEFVFVDLFALGYQQLADDYHDYTENMRKGILDTLTKGWSWNIVDIRPPGIRQLISQAKKEGLSREIAI